MITYEITACADQRDHEIHELPARRFVNITTYRICPGGRAGDRTIRETPGDGFANLLVSIRNRDARRAWGIGDDTAQSLSGADPFDVDTPTPTDSEEDYAEARALNSAGL